MYEEMYGLPHVSVPRAWRSLSAAVETQDPLLQASALNELSEALALASESEPLGFRCSELTSIIANVLADPLMSDSWLIALRCVSNLLEAQPISAQSIALHPQLMAQVASQLSNIEFIDVAEQAISFCHRLSAEQPVPLLKSGLLSPLLAHVAFFPIIVQRMVGTTVANIVTVLPRESISGVLECVPTVLELFNECSDDKLNQAWLTFFARVVTQVRMYPSHCDRLDGLGMTQCAMSAIWRCMKDPSLFPERSLHSLLNMVTSLVSRSARAAKTVLDHDGCHFIQSIYQYSAQELSALLHLGCELLPAIPGASSISSPLKFSNDGSDTVDMRQQMFSSQFTSEVSTSSGAPPCAVVDKSIDANSQATLPPIIPKVTRSSKKRIVSTETSTDLKTNAESVLEKAYTEPVTRNLANRKKLALAKSKDAHGAEPTTDGKPCAIVKEKQCTRGNTRKASLAGNVNPSLSCKRSHKLSKYDHSSSEKAAETHPAQSELSIRPFDLPPISPLQLATSSFHPPPNPKPLSQSSPLLHASSSQLSAFSSVYSMQKPPRPDSITSSPLMQPVGGKAMTKFNAQLVAIYEQDPEKLTALLRVLLPMCITGNLQSDDKVFRIKAMTCLLKALYFGQQSVVVALIRPTQTSVIARSLLDSSDLQLLTAAIKLIEFLAERMPSVFVQSLDREGVLERLHNVAHFKRIKTVSQSSSPPNTSSSSPLLAYSASFGSSLSPASQASSFSVMRVENEAKALLLHPNLRVTKKPAKIKLLLSASSRRKVIANTAFERAEDVSVKLQQALSYFHSPGPATLDAEQSFKSETIFGTEEVTRRSSKKRQRISFKQETASVSIEKTTVPTERWMQQQNAVLQALVEARELLLDSMEHRGLTTHELIKTRLLSSLYSFLHDPSISHIDSLHSTVFQEPVGTDAATNFDSDRFMLEHRRRLFAHVFMGLPLDPFFPESVFPAPALVPDLPHSNVSLVQKLLDCLEMVHSQQREARAESSSHTASTAMTYISRLLRVQVVFSAHTRLEMCKRQQELLEQILAERETKLAETLRQPYAQEQKATASTESARHTIQCPPIKRVTRSSLKRNQALMQACESSVAAISANDKKRRKAKSKSLSSVQSRMNTASIPTRITTRQSARRAEPDINAETSGDLRQNEDHSGISATARSLSDLSMLSHSRLSNPIDTASELIPSNLGGSEYHLPPSQPHDSDDYDSDEYEQDDPGSASRSIVALGLPAHTFQNPMAPSTLSFTRQTVLVDSLATLRSLDSYLFRQAPLWRLWEASRHSIKMTVGSSSSFIESSEPDQSQPLQLVWRVQVVGNSDECALPNEWKLLDKDTPLLELLNRQRMTMEEEKLQNSSSDSLREFWDRTFLLEFDVVKEGSLKTSSSSSNVSDTVIAGNNASTTLNDAHASFSNVSYVHSHPPSSCQRLVAEIASAWLPKISNSPVMEPSVLQLPVLLLLLREIHILSIRWPQLYYHHAAQAHPAFHALVRSHPLPAESEFHSRRFISQAQRDLMQPLDCACRTYPSWLHTAINYFSFLFNLDTRRLYISLNAFNGARHILALHNRVDAFRLGVVAEQPLNPHQQRMQQQQLLMGAALFAAAGESSNNSLQEEAVLSDDDDELLDRALFGRSTESHAMRGHLGNNSQAVAASIQPVTAHVQNRSDPHVLLSPTERVSSIRIRVPRNNLLSTSVPVFDIEAIKSGQLKVEFEDEEGIGRGPTLEFFTLCSQEIQKRSLKLWRDLSPPGYSKLTQLQTEASGVSESASAKRNRKRRRGIASEQPSRSSPRLQAPLLSPATVSGTRMPSLPTGTPLQTSERTSALISTWPWSSAQHARAEMFLRFCVIRCPECSEIELPLCEVHHQLLTVRESNGHWRCALHDGLKPAFGEIKSSIYASSSKPPPTPSTSSISSADVSSVTAATFPLRRSGRNRQRSADEQTDCFHPKQQPAFSLNTDLARSPISASCTSDNSSVFSQSQLTACGCSTRFSWSGDCRRCSSVSSSSASSSSFKKCIALRQIEEWCIGREELENISTCRMPSNPLSTMALQCRSCMTVDIPTTHVEFTAEDTDRTRAHQHGICSSSFYENRHGQLVFVHEQNEHIYCEDEDVSSRHCSTRCQDGSMHLKNVRFDAMLLTALQTYAATTPCITWSVKIEHLLIKEVDKASAKGPVQSGFIDAPYGLFPMASSSSSSEESSRLYKFFGQLISVALLENRLLDLSLTPALIYRLQGKACSVFNLTQVDPDLSRSLLKLHAITRKRKFLYWIHHGILVDGAFHAKELSEEDRALLQLDGCDVDDLSLDFAVPGTPSCELQSGRLHATVTLENLTQYIAEVCRFLLIDSVQSSINSIVQGLKTVLDINSLKCLSANDLNTLLSGSTTGQKCDMSVDTLRSCVKFQNGYSQDSSVITWLFELLSECNEPEQSRFIRFITGTPRLPVGGLRSLEPPLTIVKVSSRRALPSVMTCSHTLKLPEYESGAVLRTKMEMAITEGQVGFQLS